MVYPRAFNRSFKPQSSQPHLGCMLPSIDFDFVHIFAFLVKYWVMRGQNLNCIIIIIIRRRGLCVGSEMFLKSHELHSAQSPTSKVCIV